MQPLILEDLDGRELTPTKLEPESDATCRATKDEDYYLHFVTFEVEDRLFRVPSYQFFKESPLFCAMYKLSAHDRVDDGDPIKLEKVTQEEFRSLLKVLYPLSLPTMNLPSLSKKGWISVIYWTSAWKFLRVRARAINVLERSNFLTSLGKICLGRYLSIPSWVIDGLVGLVQATTITDKEALKIDSLAGAETTAYKLFRIRELRIAGELCSAKTKVEEIFKEELDRLRSAEKMFRITNEKPAKKIMGK